VNFGFAISLISILETVLTTLWHSKVFLTVVATGEAAAVSTTRDVIALVVAHATSMKMIYSTHSMSYSIPVALAAQYLTRITMQITRNIRPIILTIRI
jgi:hypothetical protein